MVDYELQFKCIMSPETLYQTARLVLRYPSRAPLVSYPSAAKNSRKGSMNRQRHASFTDAVCTHSRPQVIFVREIDIGTDEKFRNQDEPLARDTTASIH